MKSSHLAGMILLLLGPICVRADIFDQVATNKSVRTNVDFVPDNPVEALKVKAEKGDATSQYLLGWMYSNGKGVTQDKSEAVNWYRESAAQNFAPAQCNLGFCYAEGEGVTKDDAEAVKWYRKAAELNFAIGQFMLGGCYNFGKGITKDVAEAAKWYRKAAEQNFAAAQWNLGWCYDSGDGVPQDYVEAYRWYNLAAAQGNTNAIYNRNILVKSMTADQIAEAQELTREFKPQIQFGSNDSTSPKSPVASGTGFFITDDGYLISNYHVVKDATKVCLLTSAGLIDAKVVQVDAANDLALLKTDIPAPPAGYVLEHGFSSLPIAVSRAVGLGDTVATIGFPDPGLQGFASKLAKGEIASLSGAADDPRYFQISVPVQPGNSGGALVDDRGNVVGIVSAELDASAALAASGALPENVNYAVKSSLLLSFLESVPDVDARLKAPNTADEKFEDVVKSAQDAAVLVLVY